MQLWHNGPCLAHLEPGDQALAIAILCAGADLGDAARGVPFSEELLDAVLAGSARLHNANFSYASFSGQADFGGATFSGEADFGGAKFSGHANFRTATFSNVAWFRRTQFSDEANFVEAKFSCDARFGGATFAAVADFVGARFAAVASFDEVKFSGATWFRGAKFKKANFGWAAFSDDTKFVGARFAADAWFGAATFAADALFDQAAFCEDARFDGAIFDRATTIGPLFVERRLVLDGVTFSAPVEIDVTTPTLSCRRTRFSGGGHLRLRWASVDLEGGEIASPLIISHRSETVPGEPAASQVLAWRAFLVWWCGWAPAAMPRVVSLRRANVAGLVLSGLDLRACRFGGAHNLDKLKVEECRFANRPGGWPWMQRKCLAEEHHWRKESEPNRDWYPPDCQPGIDIGDVPVLQPGAVAGLYRSLRRGRELGGDEPGAADFYYGEMEMRRKARPERGGDRQLATPRAERWILGLYWLFSGYALRAWRAFAALAVVLAVASILITTIGFSPNAPAATITGSTPAGVVTLHSAPSGSVDRSFSRAVLVSLEGAVFRNPDPQLNFRGRVIQTVLRFVGPVLLGLALLSIRGRVKR